MKTFLDTNGPNRPRWHQRIIARLQRAWNHLQGLVMVEHRRPAETALIPIRFEQSGSLRPSKRDSRRN